MDWFEKSINVKEEAEAGTAMEAATDLILLAIVAVKIVGMFIFLGGVLMYIRSMTDENNIREKSNASITIGVGIVLFTVSSVVDILFL